MIQKIKAFTILEIIINLAIMGIIVSMVYLVYAYFIKNIEDYSNMSSENFEIQSFYTLLREDFYNCDKVVALNDKSFTTVFYDERRVIYSRKGNFFFRKTESKKDSIPLKRLVLEYLNREEDSSKESLVSSVSIYSLLFKEEIPLFVYKNYYSNFKNMEE